MIEDTTYTVYTLTHSYTHKHTHTLTLSQRSASLLQYDFHFMKNRYIFIYIDVSASFTKTQKQSEKMGETLRHVHVNERWSVCNVHSHTFHADIIKPESKPCQPADLLPL